jgi:hypothetical protein
LHYVKLIFNIAGAFSFAEYALFIPYKKLKDINNFAYTGISQNNYDSYSKNYKEFFDFLHTKDDNFKASMKSDDLNKAHLLKFTSHFENMHSVFLHFAIDLLFTLGELISYHLSSINLSYSGIVVSILIMFLTILISKRIFIVTGKILL